MKWKMAELTKLLNQKESKVILVLLLFLYHQMDVKVKTLTDKHLLCRKKKKSQPLSMLYMNAY